MTKQVVIPEVQQHSGGGLLSTVGMVFRFVFLMGGTVLAVHFFAPDIVDRPLGGLTLGELAFSAALAVAALWVVKIAFKKPNHRAAKIWGGVVSFVLLSATVVISFLLWPLNSPTIAVNSARQIPFSAVAQPAGASEWDAFPAAPKAEPARGERHGNPSLLSGPLLSTHSDPPTPYQSTKTHVSPVPALPTSNPLSLSKATADNFFWQSQQRLPVPVKGPR